MSLFPCMSLLLSVSLSLSVSPSLSAYVSTSLCLSFSLSLSLSPSVESGVNCYKVKECFYIQNILKSLQLFILKFISIADSQNYVFSFPSLLSPFGLLVLSCLPCISLKCEYHLETKECVHPCLCLCHENGSFSVHSFNKCTISIYP